MLFQIYDLLKQSLGYHFVGTWEKVFLRGWEVELSEVSLKPLKSLKTDACSNPS